MSFDWKSLVKTVAPVLGTALGGPFGGIATKAISNVLLGEDETATGTQLEAKIFAAINGDPDALYKLKVADQEFDIRMKEMDVDIMKIDAESQANARAMAIKTSLLPQSIIAGIFITGFVTVLYTVFSGTTEMTEDQKDIAMFLLGILSAGIVQIMNFFFGSSAGSKQKTDQMRFTQK